MPKTPAEQNAELADDIRSFSAKFDESGTATTTAEPPAPATKPSPQPPSPPKPPAAPPSAPPKDETAPAGVKPADKPAATPEAKPEAKPTGDKTAPAAKSEAEKLLDEAPKKADGTVDWSKMKEPRTGAEFKKWHAIRDAQAAKHLEAVKERDDKIAVLNARVQELEAKPAAGPAESLPTDKAEIERLTGEVKALTEKITILDVTQHPDFIRHFQGRTDAVIAEAKELVGADKAAAIEAILKIQDPDYQRAKLGDFLNDIEDEVVRDGVIGAMRDLRKIGKERQAEIAKAEQHKGTLMGKTAERATALQKELETTYAKTVKLAQDPKTGHPVFQLRTDDPAWNATVAKRLESVQKMLLGQDMTPADVVNAALRAEAEPVLRRAYAAASQAWKEEKAALVADYEAKITALKAAQPTAGTGPEPETKPESVEDVPVKDQAKWMARKMMQGL